MAKLFGLFFLIASFQVMGSQLVIRIPEKSPVTVTHKQIESNFEPVTFETKLPWFEGSRSFTGFKVTSLLNYLRITDAFSLSFIALNDYAASSRVEDILQYEPIIAYEMNGKKMKVRNKGPYWLLFNLSRHPEIDNASFHSQMVWQIDEIMIHRRTHDQ
ncbi:molybdopterin-dependent oxidoreductase [Vibrio sp. MarTm2]|uniref:molybdopterin-dependent oxidoreductase n=1 Tax=Vibrio sp. MarTm2 TaxID=2998831 RepID=UPI0022CD5608|nr:molybdopterin-dependent oxidoreductase [Vibrio sp. MarTm2]MDA0130028.1 molybdopterin-dependent oxidoreductase [Vibrio sp. MarTm2]